MKKTIILFICFLAAQSFSGETQNSLTDKMTAAITNLCPDAIITAESIYTAKYKTMIFTENRRLRTGGFASKASKEEGPGYRGFLLSVSLVDGPVNYGSSLGASCIPGAYYDRYWGLVPTENGEKHYSVRFYIGKGMNDKLKQAILSHLPAPVGSRSSRDRFEEIQKKAIEPPLSPFQ